MRLRLILLVLIAGLWFTIDPNPLAAATATPRPTATLKACHICDEEIIPPATATPLPAVAAPTPEAVVHVVMFWMATCPHCHTVLEEVLPPLQQKYGEQLELLLVEIKSEQDWERLVQVGAAYNIPQDRIELCRILIDKDPDGALEFLQTHVKGKARSLLEGG